MPEYLSMFTQGTAALKKARDTLETTRALQLYGIALSYLEQAAFSKYDTQQEALFKSAEANFEAGRLFMQLGDRQSAYCHYASAVSLCNRTIRNPASIFMVGRVNLLAAKNYALHGKPYHALTFLRFAQGYLPLDTEEYKQLKDLEYALHPFIN
ncbi:hypothetical protein HYV81_05290 [Candidatus Woesearchaeota archaeon]|nr:hypothetical protein [Candidatus Woesearchaeota archaeon]